jgi:hypothetical protein
MPNPVAANDYNPISGSLQTSRISYAVETSGKNYGQDYNGTTWYSDIPQNGSQYTIISDNYTANYYVSRSNAEGGYVEGGLPAVDEYSAPVFWMTAGTSSLDIITIVNGLPDRRGQIPFSSGSQALNWIASSSNYFAVGPPFEQIDADSLKLYLDASQIISYPTTASTWYDLSGVNNNGILLNNPTWNPSGLFDFDGTDDYVQFNSKLAGGLTQFTWTANILFDVIQPSATTPYYQLWIDENALWIAQYANAVGIDIQQTSGASWFDGNGGTVTGAQIGLGQLITGRWYNFTWTFDSTGNGGTSGQVRGYLNSIINATVNTGQTGAVKTSASNTQIGTRGGSQYFNGQIKNVNFYSKFLTQTDVTQNYYQGPVVTGSISGSYNANNIVSYASGSTATYNLSANIISGSLQNGVAFSPLNGGFWSFDGTDDRILLEGSTTSAWTMGNGTLPWTVNAWVRTTSLAAGLGVGGIFSNSSGGPIVSQLGIYNGFISYWYYLSSWNQTNGSTFISDGKWHLLTWVNNSNNTLDFYIDSKYDGTVANSLVANINYLNVIGNSYTGVAFLGDIASVQINKGKAFTADEVLQQYNATK